MTVAHGFLINAVVQAVLNLQPPPPPQTSCQRHPSVASHSCQIWLLSDRTAGASPKPSPISRSFASQHRADLRLSRQLIQSSPQVVQHRAHVLAPSPLTTVEQLIDQLPPALASWLAKANTLVVRRQKHCRSQEVGAETQHTPR